ncbi:ATP-binding protein [Actinoplanes sp. CA-142083]|uniref:ATP-binding protein n=1 Tax=Actinoplanes sp. CA-142083 TaxID=3239903 RepID=UPI003D8D900C
MLHGRSDEIAVLNGLLGAVRDGRSGALVLRGEAGVGKTALLDAVAEAAGDLRVVRVTGAEGEAELPFAALHQLCATLLDQLDGLPGPQRDALSITFGLREGPVPSPFLVAIAVLTLLSAAAAGDRPLLCVVDDAQWLDQSSAQTLAFVARRLQAEPVLMLFAAREVSGGLRGLPELAVAGLPEPDARALLSTVVCRPLDERVRDAILAEARGNPLALLELPLGRIDVAGGYALPGALPLAGKIEESFLRRLDGLPVKVRLLMLVAAADPVGDPTLMWRAAGRLGLGREVTDEAEATGLLRIGIRVMFRHTLARSAVYGSAASADRRKAHLALAEATDPRADPDRRAWHRARATEGRDETVAAELEASAGRARTRGGLAAAAAFLERAADLSEDPCRRADRELAAARLKYEAGAHEHALRLLARAAAGPAEEHRDARVGRLQAHLTFRSVEAPAQLLATARRLEPFAPDSARDTYLDAFVASVYAGRFAEIGPAQVAAAARHAPPPSGPARPHDLLLDGLTAFFGDGYEAGTPPLRRALQAFQGDLNDTDALRWLIAAVNTAYDVWDDEAWSVLSARQVRLARAAGALTALPVALNQRIYLCVHTGELAQAAALVEEAAAVARATGIARPPFGAAVLACWQGDEAAARDLIRHAVERGTEREEGHGLSMVQRAGAVLANALGRHEQVLVEAGTTFADGALAEVVEAAAKLGDRPRARQALERLSRSTNASGTAWGLGIEARSRALVSDGDAAEMLYREAIERLGGCRGAMPLARAHLLYGEWLRAEQRRADARVQLRAAYEIFESAGAAAFARRSSRELLAAGESIGTSLTRTVGRPAELTPQERQIARRARDGRSNAQIAGELFLSSRTVEWHLRKVFGKLGIANRRELRAALPETAGVLIRG